MEYFLRFLLIALLGAVSAVQRGGSQPSSASAPNSAAEIVKKVFAKGCANNYTTTCLKLDLVSMVDRLSATDSYQILPSVAVVRTDASGMAEGGPGGNGGGLPEELVTDLARGLQEAGDASAVARLDEFLVTRLGRYLDSHSVSVKLFETGILARKLGEEVMQRLGFQAAESGRKGGGFGGGKKGGMGMLGAMLIMSKATIGAIALGALALLAGKALIVGLLSLLLSAIVGIKALASKGGGGSVTYEIVQKPVYSHAHSHSHEEVHSGHGGHGGGYGRRSFDLDTSDSEDAHSIAYSSYLPEREVGIGRKGMGAEMTMGTR